MLFCYSKKVFSINLVTRAAVLCEIVNFITHIIFFFCGPVLEFFFLIFSKTGAVTYSSVEFYKVAIYLFSILRGLDVY